MPLRIAIDASRATAPQPTGTEGYSQHLIGALITANERQPHPFHFQLYFREAPAAGLFPKSPLVEEIVIRLPRLWTHLRFAAALWRAQPAISFVPAHSLPLFFPGAAIVTVHDLGFRHFPAAHPPRQRAYLDMTTRYSQSRAAIVLADSQATAADLRRFYKTPAEKIRVVYPGINRESLTPSPAAIARARKKYQLPRRYFLFLGTLQPRKNIARLVEAFARWQRDTQDEETALVLAGAKGWLFDDSWLQAADRIRVTGYIDAADKAGLYAGALALVFPSLNEGFGFPALEAMQCGTAVIASDTSSLPELVGDCGLLVNPLDTAEIAAAMRRCSDDKSLRQVLGARGRQRARRFSWEAAAAQVLAAFAELGGAR